MIALVWLLLLALAAPSFGQESFTATVDRSALRVGETLNLTLTFSGAASGLSEPTLPALEKLQVVGGPFSNQSFSIVNGRASSSLAFTYVVKAREPGQGRIGEARITYKGREYATTPVTVTIAASGSSLSSAGSKGGTADIFIRVIPDKTKAYVGEQITLTYKIYFAVQMSNPEIRQMPRATGFWVEEMSLPQHLSVTDEVVGGRQYRAAVIRKLALFPTTSGDLEVEPLVLATRVERAANRRLRDPFDIFNDPLFQMGRPLEEVEVESPNVRLRIEPLPQTGVPLGFSGAVGTFKISTSLDRQVCKANEGATLTVALDGLGNIKTLQEPAVSFPPDIQRYDPETSEDVRRNAPRVSGTKTFKYLMIPRAAGLQVIPGITWSYFDPDRGKYLTITTPDLRLQVEKGEGPSNLASGITVAAKRGVESVGTDIAFVKTRPGPFVSMGGTPHGTVGFWLLTSAPWAAVLGVSLGLRRRARQDVTVLRRAAARKAARMIGDAEKAFKSGKSEPVFRFVGQATDSILQVLLGPSAPTMTTSDLEEAWRQRQFDPDLLQAIIALRSECDQGRYAAVSVRLESARALVEKARALVEETSRAQGRAGPR